MARICLLIFLILVGTVFSVQVIARNSIQLRLDNKILQESIVKLINDNAQSGWKASMSPRFANYTVGQFMHLLGVKPMPEGDLKGISVVTHRKGLKLPKKFDARTAWPQCSTIGDILDQGHCGSCWAFGAVEALSDRFCIRFGMNISLSVNDLLACCGFMCGDGCDGGYPISAWRYFVHTGVVTAECDPYFDNSGCSHPGCEPAYPTPKCEKKCSKLNLLWRDTKHFSVDAYRIGSDPYSIMAEVFTNGPVEVSFTVYEDFAHYKSGVYKHVTGGEMGGHAVKLIGWGTTEDGEDYWLLANQWNRSWGDAAFGFLDLKSRMVNPFCQFGGFKIHSFQILEFQTSQSKRSLGKGVPVVTGESNTCDGYFMIRRGTNECGIEEDVVAGLPSSRNLIHKYGASRDASI